MEKLKIFLPPALLLTLVLGAMHLYVLSRVNQERRDITERLERVCARKGRAIEVLLSQLTYVSRTGASLVRLGVLDRKSFDGTADALESVFPAVVAMGMLPDGIIEAIYPMHGREAALGMNFFEDPVRSPGSDDAVRDKAPVVTGPLLLTTGKTGFIARAPVFSDKDGKELFWGFVGASSTVDRLVGLAGLDHLPEEGFAYRLEKGGDPSGKEPSLAGCLPEGAPEAQRTVAEGGVKLRLRVAWAGAWPGLPSFWPGYLGAAAFGLLAAGLLCRMIGRMVVLEARAKGRADRLFKANRRMAVRLGRLRETSGQLAATLEITRSMFEDSPAAKILVDPLALSIKDANTAAARFFGRSREELAGMPLTDAGLEPREEIGRAMAQAARGENGPFLAWRGTASGEARFIEIYSNPVRHHGKLLLQSVIQDVTARETALRELEDYKDVLGAMASSPEAEGRAAGDPGGGDVPVLDSQGALRLLLGNKELYGRMLDGFVREYASSGETMLRLLAEGRAEEAARLAHSIKGLAANLGGERLRLEALRLETALGEGGAPLTPPCVDGFAAALAEFASQAASLASEICGKDDA